MDEIERRLQQENIYYTGNTWIPDFISPIPRPYCSYNEALDVLMRFKIEDKWKTKNELDELLSEYGIFSYEKWMEEKELFEILNR